MSKEETRVVGLRLPIAVEDERRIIVEIPHQLPPSVWIAYSEIELIDIATDMAIDSGEPQDVDDTDEAIEIIAHDLNGCFCYTIPEAREYLARIIARDCTGHGELRVMIELSKVLDELD